jgi:NAD(P)-dependent dehydrogenase (short-subunit alcohol dehydrogenase family)
MSDKVIVVTGATGRNGTGRATAKYFAAQGWSVVVNFSRDAEAATEVAAQCTALGAPHALEIQADVGRDECCKRLAAEVRDKLGRCDLLVNNAAMTRFVPHTDLEGMLADDFARVLNVNVMGCFQMSRALFPLLKEAKGQVINISSMGSLTGKGSCIAYSASKAGINALTLALARALAPDVRVNALLPGFIDGEWLEGWGSERLQALRASHVARSLLSTVLDPQDIAEAIWWMNAGPAKQTGELVKLDAGTHLGMA